MAEREQRVGRLLKRREHSLRGLPHLTEVLRGTLSQRHVRCGKPGCHCQKGAGHGPITYLSVSLGVGRSQQITIAAADQEAAAVLVQNYRRVQAALEQVSEANRELLQLRSLPRPEQSTRVKRPRPPKPRPAGRKKGP